MRLPRWRKLVNVTALGIVCWHMWGLLGLLQGSGPPEDTSPQQILIQDPSPQQILIQDPIAQPILVEDPSPQKSLIEHASPKQIIDKRPPKDKPATLLRRGNLSQFELVSEMKSTHNTWPYGDTVDKICRVMKWRQPGVVLPDVSVVITFYNAEHLFNLVHTIHAVVRRSPPDLLREVILIDDHTWKDEFRSLLAGYVKSEFGELVRLVRSPVYLGLIQARLHGIRAAKGKVVVVIDSHVEPQPRWLEPILYEIAKDRRTLASSYIDWMAQNDAGEWTYTHVGSSWKTYFDWGLVFGFQALSNEVLTTRQADPTAPVESAVTVGNWAMDRAWFEEVGAFDEGMQRWGGENIDLAVRVWLFGGRVVNIPCSHLGHMENKGSRDYRSSWTHAIHFNYKRFAQVWMDDYQKHFYQQYPDLKTLDAGNLTSRLALKARTKHDFSWFLKNVLPELNVPDVNVYAYGGIMSAGQRCFDTMHRVTPGLNQCTPRYMGTQGVSWTKEGLLRLPMHVVLAMSFSPSIIVNGYTSYHNTGRATQWFHIKNGPIIDTKSGLCMTVNATTDKLFLAECRDLPSQHWAFRFYTKDYDQPHIDNIPVKSRIKSIIKMFTGLVRNRITWPYFGLPKLQTVI